MGEEKKIMLSGIQPSGDLHLGNYLGAIKNWADRVNDYDCYYFMADMHTITVRQDPKELRRRSLEMLAIYIACGLDPEKNTLFLQSHVPAHAQLGWVLDCYTMFGELTRMTQFKDKSEKHKDNINAGLFTYPELCRNIANRFNNIYGDVFRVPEPFISKVGARIYGLTTPDSKMSKSIPQGCVFLMDEPNVIMKKFKRAITDSDTERCVRYDRENKPGVANLMNIYATITGKTFEEIEREFEGQGYGVFKPAVGEAVVDVLTPIREEAKRLIADKAYLNSVYREGAEKASYIANKTLRKVYKKIGFYQIDKK